MAFCLINKSNYFYNLSLIEKKISKDNSASKPQRKKKAVKENES